MVEERWKFHFALPLKIEKRMMNVLFYFSLSVKMEKNSLAVQNEINGMIAEHFRHQ